MPALDYHPARQIRLASMSPSRPEFDNKLLPPNELSGTAGCSAVFADSLTRH